MLFLNVILALAALPAVLGHDDTIVHSQTSTAKITCATKYSSKSQKPVKTSTITTTEHEQACRITDTIQSVKTITPKPCTSTKLVFTHTTRTVTDSAVTGTYTSISTAYTISTLAITPTVTISSTDTEIATDTVVTTVPTSSGFLPIEDTTSSVYPAPVQKRYPDSYALSPRGGRNVSPCSGGSKPPGFPAAVICTKKVVILTTTTIVKTGYPRTVTARPSTAHTTKTSTITSTSTIVPPEVTATVVSVTTSTITSVITVDAVTTISATTTTLHQTNTVTSYAACATNNIAGPILADGTSVIGGGTYDNVGIGFVSSATTGSAVGCCELCQQTANCAGSFFYVPSGLCNIFTYTTCSAQSQHKIFYDAEAGQVGDYALSNGACGYAYRASGII